MQQHVSPWISCYERWGEAVREHKTHPPSRLRQEESRGEKERRRKCNNSELVSFLPVCLPSVCQPNILKQHMRGLAAANYPAFGTRNWKTSFENNARAGLLCALSVSADRLLLLMNIQYFKAPSRGLWANVVPLSRAFILICYQTHWNGFQTKSFRPKLSLTHLRCRSDYTVDE